jgi:hypothetical protein
MYSFKIFNKNKERFYCIGSYSFELFFPLVTDFNSTSLIYLPKNISEVRANSVPEKEQKTMA